MLRFPLNLGMPVIGHGWGPHALIHTSHITRHAITHMRCESPSMQEPTARNLLGQVAVVGIHEVHSQSLILPLHCNPDACMLALQLHQSHLGYSSSGSNCVLARQQDWTWEQWVSGCLGARRVEGNAHEDERGGRHLDRVCIQVGK